MSLLKTLLPRREGSRGTEISTLPGGQNLGDLDDVNYFKEKLYQSLNVPISRINQDNNFQLGRASDISRDEIKFSKFIKRLRKQFAEIFNEVLRVQLVLKGICTQNEFEEMRQYISYDYLKDMHFDQLKQVELLNDQLSVLRDASEYVGKYFSIEYVRKVILGQTEEDIARIDREIMDEMEKEQIKDPDDPVNFSYEEVISPRIKPSGRKDVLTINTETLIEDKDAASI
jgi:Bacteriophage T4-like capsid assembly protein (Gp20).